MRSPATAVRYAVVAVSVVYAVVLYLVGFKFEEDLRRLLAYLPTVFFLGVVVFDKWVWRWPLVHYAFKRARIDGLWRATLIPAPGSQIPAGGNWGPIAAYVVIDQSFWSLHVRLYTKESQSDSVTSTFENIPGTDHFDVTFTYRNTPKPLHVKRSPRHIGVTQLGISGSRPESVAGIYFTDRFTKGDISIDLIDRKSRPGSFYDAERKEDLWGQDGMAGEPAP